MLWNLESTVGWGPVYGGGTYFFPWFLLFWIPFFVGFLLLWFLFFRFRWKHGWGCGWYGSYHSGYHPPADEILRNRYARGEITAEEYEEMKKRLG